MSDAPPRHDRLGDVFEQALDRPPGDRAAFLDRACADDPALRDEVAALLAAHDAAPDYLGRLVALKVLPLAADDGARERLRREAQAASALDHPHLATVYDLGRTADGTPFVAMAYVEGETLGDRLERGPLTVPEAAALARQVASGLAEVHRHGIVHRDVKPSNVLVTPDGAAKLVDFGIARTPGSELTREGLRLGSPAYMSPEQTRGEAVDARTDLWSLGALIYEMLAGAPPFPADSTEAVVARIRTDEPAPLPHVSSDASLVRVMRRCLAKNPAERFASADDLLRALQGEPEPDDRRTGLVVLPFANLSPDPDNAYFSDGLTDEVITDLSQIRSLRVISRSSARRLPAHEADSRALARELGVRYVVEGSVRKSTDALRISVQLTDAPDGSVVWARTLDGRADEVFDLQERVAREIAQALRLQLSPEEAEALAARPIPDVRAYDSYLRARYEAYRFSKDGLDRARRYIETALGIVGDNDLLYSALGHITAMYVDAGVEAGPHVLARIDALADTVFELNPASARGHWLKAFSAFYRGDVFGAIRAGERALALAPDEPDALLLLGYVYGHVGRTAEAASLFDRALRVDPLTPLTAVMPGFVAAFEGRFEDAVGPYRRGFEMEPDSPFAVFFYGWALACADHTEAALRILDGAAVQFAGSPFGALARSFAYALRGDADGATGAVAPGLEAAAQGSGMFARELAHVHALAGRPEAALDWLGRAVDLGLLNEAFLATHDPFLASVRGTSRFEGLLDRVRAALAR